MPKNQTEKSRYPSKYSPDKFVTVAQYITECICEKKADGDLPAQFWNLPEWNKFYRSQIASANALVKKYGAKPVIEALKDKRCYKTYSLRAPWFVNIVKEYFTKSKKLKDAPTSSLHNSGYKDENLPTTRTKTKKNTDNRLSKLMDL